MLSDAGFRFGVYSRRRPARFGRDPCSALSVKSARSAVLPFDAVQRNIGFPGGCDIMGRTPMGRIRAWLSWFLLAMAALSGGLALSPVSAAAPADGALREPVHPRRNVEDFPVVEAKFIRFIIRATNRGEPCLDELEIY